MLAITCTPLELHALAKLLAGFRMKTSELDLIDDFLNESVTLCIYAKNGKSWTRQGRISDES